jgi:TonB family protein
MVWLALFDLFGEDQSQLLAQYCSWVLVRKRQGEKIMKNMRRRLLSSICAFALIANGVGGMAQTQGELTGAITDSSGAIIVGATVTVTNTATGAAHTVMSNDAGVYRFPALLPGGYTLRIDAPGFMTVRSKIQVHVERAVRLNVTLEVGQLTESIDILAVDQAGGTSRVPEGANSSSVKVARIGGGAFQFFSQEMSFDNNLVVGAPFSADIGSETIQTLADGTRIVQSFAGQIYRDSQGRTRNERAFQMGGTSESIQTIAIYDPIGGANYILDLETRIAHKTDVPVRVTPPRHLSPSASVPASESAKAEAPKIVKVSSGVLQGRPIKKVAPPYPSTAKAARASGPVLVQILIGETGEVLEAAILAGHPLLREAALQAARQWRFMTTTLSGVPVKIRGILQFNFKLIDEELSPAQDAKSASKYAINTERFNNQLIEGILCEGTRKVTTIPVGAIGNDRPIEMVSETWYSPELSMIILSKRSDPRFGESTYRVTNINRVEPESTLFHVPPDFTIKSEK